MTPKRRYARSAAGSEELDYLVFRPGMQPGFEIPRQGRCIPVVQRGAGEIVPAVLFAACFHLAGKAPRCVAFAAMPQTLHEVGAAVPRCAFIRIGGVLALFEIERIPDRL